MVLGAREAPQDDCRFGSVPEMNLGFVVIISTGLVVLHSQEVT